jgi:hypothetical protein
MSSKLIYTTCGNLALEESETALLGEVENSYSYTDLLVLADDVWQYSQFFRLDPWNNQVQKAWEEKFIEAIDILF